MSFITTSLFELFKIGPGPSSSHTIGPMKAGYCFMEEVRKLDTALLEQADIIEIHLFGSLSATGEGHGTRRAVISGLLGHQPETCHPDVLDGLDHDPEQVYPLDIGPKSIDFKGNEVVFDAVEHDYPYSNTMVFRLQKGEKILFEQEYYSIGGGFLRWKGWEEPQIGEPKYKYKNMAELKKHLVMHEIRLHDLILENEMAITGLSENEIYERLDNIIMVMERAVEQGIQTEGILPGPIGLHRKAPTLYAKAKRGHFQGPGFLKAINAYAMGASEENAAGHCIVTAPTAGAAGVIPALLFMLKRHMGALTDEIRQGLMAAAAIGFLAKNNASISGAEVGCQGEVGVASAMGAAMMAYARGYRFQVTENSAEIALEHHLGLTCDPVGGYVQIPCIERNAMGAVKAYNAYLIASSVEAAYHMVDLDKVIKAMAETGRDMSRKYKETSLGGLAVSVIEC
ncbi:L-serine ammonia-lyase [Salidesulfovibrio onnuriiensis]|uniref:L-serine ammonia-lyase n=1 Tax=Salidesulfovibrio onnuriiensis TaxID=2583823 RepID=UPI0011CAE26A|nr:L-serine ammonia-lyase [Salidesulfovibrio onnuriiensis]